MNDLNELLSLRGRPLGAQLGVPREELELVSPLRPGAVEKWSRASGEVELGGVKALVAWELDRESGLLCGARADLRCPDSRRVLDDVARHYEGAFGKPKKSAAGFSWQIDAGLKGVLTAKTVKQLPDLVVVELAVAKGERLRKVGATATEAPATEVAPSPVRVPKAILEVLFASPPLGSAKEPRTLKVKGAGFPPTATLTPALSAKKVIGADLSFPDFTEERPWLDVYGALLDALTARHGAPRGETQSGRFGDRRFARWTVDGHVVSLWSFEFDDVDSGVVQRQVGVESRREG